MIPFRLEKLFFVVAVFWLTSAARIVSAERPRLAVLTDIGGDPDDQQSLVRLMAYANEFEVEAMIASAAGTRGELKEAVTRPDLVREIIAAYEQVLPNLKRHAQGWPTADQLRSVVRSGNRYRTRTHIGPTHDSDASRFLIERIDAGDADRPLNIAIWGGQTDLGQALWRVKTDRGRPGLDAFVSKFRVYDINDQDGIADWMRTEFPGMHYLLAKAPPGRDKREGTYRGMYLTGDEGLTSLKWIEKNIRSTGRLGSLYPTKTFTAPNKHGCLKEGDTPSWFFFLPLGGNLPNDPSKPGWGGQFQRDPDGWWRDLPANDGFDPRHTVSRWRPDFQADFAKRMSWSRSEAVSRIELEETSSELSDMSRGAGGTPYPPSPVIAAIEWAPKESIVQKAKDGDNWPVTWADDDALYTTYGDGTGFEPKVESKLSLGFARVLGTPSHFIGTNVRSASEQFGPGRQGKKGWGILCVENVLYLWLGHADQKGAAAQLCWSSDHAKSWTFADWKFAEFGLIGFINFGKNYAGARDDFVYAYSHDDPRADTPADRFILMRAPKDRLLHRQSWEFFRRLDADGRPEWTKDIRRRGTVFEHPGACLRSAMTFCGPLKRYLWWQQLPQTPGLTNDRGDTRFKGGFAVYDAPEPWGPWTTAYFTNEWDVGPGEHGDFPSKWMSSDGQRLQLVFSGDDAFSVRQAKIIVR